MNFQAHYVMEIQIKDWQNIKNIDSKNRFDSNLKLLAMSPKAFLCLSIFIFKTRVEITPSQDCCEKEKSIWKNKVENAAVHKTDSP